jgi:hypothetical protein
VADAIVVKKPRRKLKTANHVRLLVAATIREVESASLPLEDRARLLGYLGKILLTAIEASERDVKAQFREVQRQIAETRADFAKFKGSPEYTEWLRRTALKKSGDDDDPDEAVLQRQDEYRDAQLVKRREEQEQRYIEEHAPSIGRAMRQKAT